MDNFVSWIQDFQLNYGHIIRPLIVGTLVSIVCSVIGCFIVLRRMSFLADAIAHSMLAGVIAAALVADFLLMPALILWLKPFGPEAPTAQPPVVREGAG